MEAVAKISFSADIKIANREREVAEAEAEISEKAEKTRKAREVNSKSEAETDTV